MAVTMTKTCSHCKQEKPVEEFYCSTVTRDGLTYYCKACAQEASRQHRSAHVDEAMLRASPACGMCGVELDYGPKGHGRGQYNRDNSPSLDRFVPSLGYVGGNVGVLCHKCNAQKSDNTLESALRLVEYLTRNAPSIGRRAA